MRSAKELRAMAFDMLYGQCIGDKDSRIMVTASWIYFMLDYLIRNKKVSCLPMHIRREIDDAIAHRTANDLIACFEQLSSWYYTWRGFSKDAEVISKEDTANATS